MDKNIWLERWEQNRIAFHEPDPNPLLVNNFNQLSLPEGSRVFLPLCGKTLDIPWLLAKGYAVAGAELIKIAVEQLFSDLGVQPVVTSIGGIDRYSADRINIFCGDIFHLSADLLGPIQAIYDRAALVALPAELRVRYAKHLTAITANAPQLLITYEYDQSLTDGPPFSVSKQEVEQHYQSTYRITHLSTTDVQGGLRGQCPAKEHTWLLNRQ